jgi:hypothetical protein
MNNFQAQRLGITAFMASNRVDFVLDGPDMDAPARCSAFYNNPEAKIKLDGKQLKIEAVTTDDDGAHKQLQIKWGRRVIKLGRRSNASGPVSFYRSLEDGNQVAGPKSTDALNAAFGNFFPQETPVEVVEDDDIPF